MQAFVAGHAPLNLSPTSMHATDLLPEMHARVAPQVLVHSPTAVEWVRQTPLARPEPGSPVRLP